MPIRVSYLVGVTMLLFAATACGGGSDSKPAATESKGSEEGRWLGTGGPCEDLEKMQNNKDMKENVGFLFCSNAGHTFTGELRCERDLIEVKCR